MKRLRLGVIGIGMAWEDLHWPAIKELGDHYEVVAVCNRTKKDAEDFANSIGLNLENVYDDYKEMLKRDDLDAVDVLVPIEDNFEIAKAVIEAGKNLIAEKPLAATMEGAQELVELSNKYDGQVMVAENYRYNEENNILKDIIEEGAIGEVMYFIENNMSDFTKDMKGDSFAAKEWRQHPEYRGGTFLDSGIHHLAGLRHIFGPVNNVYAVGQPGSQDFDPYRSISAQMEFKSGVIGQYNYCSVIEELHKPLIGLRIFGTKGEIYLEDRASGTIYISLSDGTTEQRTYRPNRGYYNELANFYDAVIEGKPIQVTPEVGYGDVKMVFDILASIKSNQPIRVD